MLKTHMLTQGNAASHDHVHSMISFRGYMRFLPSAGSLLTRI